MRMARLVVFAVVVGLVGCTTEGECVRNSDCAPGRFCSPDFFCEFQCRTDADCGGGCSCDPGVGICRAAKDSPLCCVNAVVSASYATTRGLCLDPDMGVDFGADLGADLSSHQD
jgi:hypothetical protein